MVEAFSVRVDGVGLEVRRWPGEGTPILLLHEALGSAGLWRDFPARLAEQEGRPVFAWSRQGYGRSDPVRGPRGLAYLEDEGGRVARILDALVIDRAHLYGHSDGATIALIAAALAPDRVESAIVEAPHVFVESATVAGVSAAGRAYRTTGLREKLLRHHDDVDSVFGRWESTWLDPAFRSWSIEALLPRISAPLLLIQGTADAYATMAQLDRIGAAVPHAKRLELIGIGHVPHREATDAVLRAIATFYADLPGT